METESFSPETIIRPIYAVTLAVSKCFQMFPIVSKLNEKAYLLKVTSALRSWFLVTLVSKCFLSILKLNINIGCYIRANEIVVSNKKMID